MTAKEALEAALRANEKRWRDMEIDTPEYQAGIDAARRRYRIATGQATDWKAVADDLYEMGSEYAADMGHHHLFKEAYNRSVSEHTEKE